MTKLFPTLSSWTLAGALAASLAWNWAQQRNAPPAAEAAGGACSLDSATLGLEPELARQLSELCSSSCGESDRLEKRADELQRELLASLSAPEVDRAEAARLVGEVGELRRRSLEACVEGVLGVRELVGPERVRALLASCQPGGCGESCESEGMR